MSTSAHGDTRSLSVWSFIATLLMLVASCASTTGHSRANSQELSELCPDDSEPLQSLDEDDACGSQLLKLTGSAACDAGNSDGCMVGATFSFIQRNDGGILANDGFEERVRTAVDLAERGCEMGNELSCMQRGAFIMTLDGSRSDKIAALRQMDQQCRAGMGIVCHALGFVAVEMSSDSEGYQQAAEYQRMSCDDGFRAGCWKYAQMVEEGVGVEANSSRARELYEKACELGDGDACEKIGKEQPLNDDPTVLDTVAINSEKFLGMTDTACKSFRHACTLAGLYIDRGEVQSDQEDLAFSYYERGCEQDSMTACMLLAINYQQGDGVDANTKKAAELARRACNGGIEKSCEIALEYEFRVLDEKGAKAKAEQCKTGDAEACFLAGGAYRHGANFPTSEGKSVNLNTRGCQLGLAAACTAAANVLQRGISGEENRDAREANELFARGCELEDEDACRNLGVNLAIGNGSDENHEKAFDYFRRGCELGSSVSCGALANYYFQGFIADQDLAKAEELHRKGCTGGLMSSCRQLAQILESNGTDGSFEKAVGLYSYACERDEGAACTRLGELYGRSDGAEKKRRGISYFERACLLEHQEGCANLGIAMMVWEELEVDLERGEKLLRDTCDQYSPACIYLANMFRDGKGVDRNATMASDLYGQACDAENWSGCSNLGWLILNDQGVEYRPKKAIDLYEKACDMGDTKSCRGVHSMLLDGFRVAPQPERAYSALTKACDNGDFTACNDVADHLYIGLGVPRDTDQARATADRVHEHYAAQCKEGGAICGFFAHSIAHRHGPADKNLEEARAFLAKSCEAGEIWSCGERAEQMATGELYVRDRDGAMAKLRALCTEESHTSSCIDLAFFAGHGTDDEIRPGEAFEQYRNVCDMGNIAGCIRAGRALALGHGVDADPDAGIAMLEKACTDTEFDGCEAYYMTLLELGRINKPQEVFERVSSRCEEGFTSSCRVASDLHGAGIGTARNLDLARAGYERACRISADGTTCSRSKEIASALPDLKSSRNFESACTGGRASACAAAGLRAEWGIGADEPSTPRAAELYEKGCEGGDAPSCRLLFFLDAYWRSPATGSLVYKAVEGGCTSSASEFCESSGRAISSHNWDLAAHVVRRACVGGRPSACLWLSTNGEATR